MSERISRRTWLTSVSALGGLLVTGCSRETFVPPRVRGGLIGAADVLTMSTNRLLLSGQQLAREYSRSDVADPFPTWNQTNPRNAEYQLHASEGFRNWRLPISGLVQRPRELSLDEIKSLPARTQITAHICEQGWSAIGEWTGAPLQRLIEEAGGVTPAARYVVIDTFDGWLRLRVERQCGYKNLKFLKSIRVVDSMAGIGRGTGGINSDFGFHWFAGV